MPIARSLPPLLSFRRKGCSSISFTRCATHSNAAYTRLDRSVIQPQPQPTTNSEDGGRTLRTRQHGNRTLPLPPLMDPIAIEAKERYKHAKRDPVEKKELTDFQRELGKNPFARALATPVRYCTVTKARLPSHFMLSFQTVISPATTASPIHGDEDTLAEGKNTTTSLPPTRAPPQPSLVASSSTSDGISTGAASYTLNRHDILSHLSRRGHWGALVSSRMQDAYARLIGRSQVKVQKQWTYDPMMPDRVLENLRKEVVHQLRRVWKDGERSNVLYPLSEYAVLSTDKSEEAQEKVRGMVVSALLHIPGANTSNSSENEERNSIASHDCPSYNLRELLRGDPRARLEGLVSLEADYTLIVLRHPRSVALLLALDRLRMYLMPEGIVQAAPEKEKRGRDNPGAVTAVVEPTPPGEG